MNALTLVMTGIRKLPRAIPLFRDPKVPLWSKVATIAAVLFILSPLNLLGDIPGLGFLDDGALVVLVLGRFVSYAEKHAASVPPSVEPRRVS